MKGFMLCEIKVVKYYSSDNLRQAYKALLKFHKSWAHTVEHRHYRDATCEADLCQLGWQKLVCYFTSITIQERQYWTILQNQGFCSVTFFIIQCQGFSNSAIVTHGNAGIVKAREKIVDMANQLFNVWLG